MKYRIFSVLMILAMVASLCVIAAVPVSAQVDNVVVTLSDTNASKTSRYQIEFDATNPLAAGVDDIIIEFPSAADVPASIDASKVSVDNTLCSEAGSGGDVAVSGNKVIITVPVACGGGAVKVIINQGAGIVNPQVSQEMALTAPGTDTAVDNPYIMKVSTTQDLTPVASGTFAITDWITASEQALYEGQACTVNGGGFWPGATVELSGPISGSALVGSNGKFTVTAYGTGASGTATAKDGSGRIALLGGFTVLPSLDVSPDSGPVTKTVTITGYNFGIPAMTNPAPPAVHAANIWVGILWFGTVQVTGNVNPPPHPIAALDLDNDGAFDDFVYTFNVPRKAVAGINTISIIDWAKAGSPSAQAEFDVTPRTVTVDPASGAPGSSVTIQGIGWPPGEPDDGIVNYSHNNGGIAKLIYGNTTAAGTIAVNIEVDDMGNFTAVGNIPDDAQPGVHGIVVYFDPTDSNYDGADNNGPCANPALGNTCNDELGAQGMFTVTDRDLTVVPSSGPFGTQVTISGGNFGADAGGLPDPFNVAQLWVNGDNTGNTLDLTTSGALVPETVMITDTWYNVGPNEIRARNATFNIAATSYFEVTRPTMTMDKTRGPRGTEVVVTGEGWLPGEQNFVTIERWIPDDNDWKAVKMATPDENGKIWATFKIPSNIDVQTGDANVRFRAQDQNDNKTLETIFIVTRPGITVDPEAAAPGETIKIVGKGFLPQTAVAYVTLGGARIVRSDDLPLTGLKGEFEVTGVVPGLAPAGYPVKVMVDEDSGEVTAPFIVMASAEGDITVPVGFFTIEGLYTIVWTFDAATQQYQVYDTAEGAPDDFDTLIKGQGYWLYVTEDCTLTFGQYTYNLKKGWNLIGWLG